MKNLLKHSLVFAILLTSSVSFADEVNVSIKVKENDQKQIVFSVNELQKVNFSIYSLTDGIIYEQNIQSSKALTTIYNLEAFPDGNYFIKLTSSAKLIEYQVNISKGKTVISEPVITEQFKPVLVKENDLITLDLKDVSRGPIEIKIFNELNDELYAKTFANKAAAEKKFNISGADAKELTFMIRSKDQEFIDTVSIK